MKNKTSTSKRSGFIIGLLTVALLVMGGLAPTAIAEGSGSGEGGPSCVEVGAPGGSPWVQVDPQCDPVPDHLVPPL